MIDLAETIRYRKESKRFRAYMIILIALGIAVGAIMWYLIISAMFGGIQ